MGEDFYENILTNKQKTFSDIKDVLEALRGESKLVIIVDDFDLIDETSFEFIKYLTNKDFFTQGAKFLLTYRNQNALNMYINSDKQTKNACLNINLAANEIDDIKEHLKLRLGSFEVLPEKISNQIILNSQGNFAYIEQVIEHLIETKKIYLKGKEFVYDIKEENYSEASQYMNFVEIWELRWFLGLGATYSEYLSSSSGSSFSLPRRMPCISEVEPRSTTCSISLRSIQPEVPWVASGRMSKPLGSRLNL